MMKAIGRTIRTLLLLLFFLRNPCDGSRVGRERGRRFRTRDLKRGVGNIYKQESLTKGPCKERKGISKANGKSGTTGGKESTCSPTTSPSFSPSASPSASPSKDPSATPSTEPSSIPLLSPRDTFSASPSKDPSSTPSTMPSLFPSLSPSVTSSASPSKDPSATPSTMPSSFPSLTPSDIPSESLHPSVSPSTKPSSFPSSIPSLTPSGNPSTSPSEDPSVSPSTKPSSFPTSFPSVPPSDIPSTSPSQDPTIQPSTEPTFNPTISAAPSVKVFETVSTTAGLQSTCIDPQPSEVDGGTFNEDLLLVFEYVLFVPGTVLKNDEKDGIVAIMEDQIHEGLVQNFLTCNAAQGKESFYVWSIFENPRDFISSDPCDSQLVAETNPAPPNGSKCILVQAELNMQVYFPPIRRHRHLNNNDDIKRILAPASTTNVDHEVMAKFGDYLTRAMSEGTLNDDERILQTRFLAFITEGEGHATIDRGTLNVAGAEGQLMSGDKRSRVVGGAMTMAAAAIFLIVVAILTLRRNKKRSDAFRRHIDDLSTCSDFEKDDFGTEIVGDLDSSSLGWFSEDYQNGICLQVRADKDGSINANSLNRQHDVHKCASAFCAICLKQQTPTFIASNSLNVPDILEDLCSGSSVFGDRSYSSPNTVNL